MCMCAPCHISSDIDVSAAVVKQTKNIAFKVSHKGDSF